MKRHTYPSFRVSGLVTLHEQGASSPSLEVRATGYISFQWEAHSVLIRDAKRRLERLGMPKECLDALSPEYAGTTECFAIDARGVRRDGCERVEAFFDSPTLKKRDVLIRQRRVIPHDHADMVEMYGPKPAAPATEAATEAAAA